MPDGIVLRDLPQLEGLLRQYIQQGLISQEIAANLWDWAAEGERARAAGEVGRAEASWARVATAVKGFEQQIQATEKAELGAGLTRQERQAVQLQTARERAKVKDQPILPSEASVFAPFLEKLSPNMRRYFEPRLSKIAAEFEAKHPGAREKWLGQVGRPSAFERKREGLAGAERMGARRLGGIEQFGDITDLGETRMTGRARREVGAATRAREQLHQAGLTTMREGLAGAERGYKEKQDPFLRFLGGYPFMEQWLGMSPRQRGEFKSRYRPVTRFLNF